MVALKKIAVLGGTGMTGVCVVEEILSSGLIPRLLLRPTSVLPDEFADRVEVVRGDATDAAKVKEALTGTDAVVVALGTRNDLGPTTEMSTGVENVLKAMTELGIKPISVCLSTFLLMPEERVPPPFHEINKEHGRMLAALEKNENVNWVGVFPPHIADTPRTDFLVKEGALPGGRTVSKRDLAAFLVQSLSQPEHYHKKIAISSKA